jgi:hypothetical protein
VVTMDAKNEVPSQAKPEPEHERLAQAEKS